MKIPIKWKDSFSFTHLVMQVIVIEASAETLESVSLPALPKDEGCKSVRLTACLAGSECSRFVVYATVRRFRMRVV